MITHALVSPCDAIVVTAAGMVLSMPLPLRRARVGRDGYAQRGVSCR